MAKPYSVVITKPGGSPDERRYQTVREAALAYGRSVIALARFEADIELRYTPPIEAGMFGIPMPVEVIAKCHWRRR